MTDQANSVPHPWRRFLRFSVRGMIVLVLVIGGWLGWIVRSAGIQREAVAAIDQAGGEVKYDSGSTRTPTLKTHELWAPKWAVDALGVDYFGHVCEVTLTLNCTDRELADVGRLTALDSLRLYYPNVSDSGLVQLQGLTKLSKLVLSQTQISDAGLAHRSRCRTSPNSISILPRSPMPGWVILRRSTNSQSSGSRALRSPMPVWYL